MRKGQLLLLFVIVVTCCCVYTRAECPMMTFDVDDDDYGDDDFKEVVIGNPHQLSSNVVNDDVDEDADAVSSYDRQLLRTRSNNNLFNHGSNSTTPPTTSGPTVSITPPPTLLESANASSTTTMSSASLSSNLFATAIAAAANNSVVTTTSINNNSTEGGVSTFTHCPTLSRQCGPTRSCASIGLEGYCCSRWGYCGQSPQYCGECCQNGCLDDTTYYPTYSPSIVTPGIIPTRKPTARPTRKPTSKPLLIPLPSPETRRPTSTKPTTSPPTTTITTTTTLKPSSITTSIPPTTRSIPPTTRKPTTTTIKPSSSTTSIPPTTRKPTTPSPTTRRPTSGPTRRPTSGPTRRPTSGPTRRPTSRATEPAVCTTSFTSTTYDTIDADILVLKNNIPSSDSRSRAHFLGGIVRLVAHDFMDYDPSQGNAAAVYGADGCFDPDHGNNSGLSDIWSPGRPLFELHRDKYSHISKADFWVASANAVIRQTSVGNALNMKTSFKWGRKDKASCPGSGERLPIPSRCSEVDRVFRTRMGLSWRDAVALLGAHTLGRGDRSFSRHEGTWKDNNSVAQVFDTGYYSEMLDNNWRMRNIGGPANGGPPQDFTTGSTNPGSAVADNLTGRFMLNTDICLAFNIDNIPNPRCCTKFGTSSSSCDAQCPTYSTTDSRRQAANAVSEFDNFGNDRFYAAYSSAWNKAIVLGQSNLKSLTSSCA